MSKPALPLTWCLVLMFEVVGLLQGRQKTSSSVPMWGNTRSSVSSSSSAQGACAAPSEHRETSAHFGATQTCWATLLLGFPSPLQHRSLSVWSPCVLLGGEGEERKQGLCQGIAVGRGDWGCASTNSFGIYELLLFLFFFVLFCFFLQQSVIEQVSWDN